MRASVGSFGLVNCWAGLNLNFNAPQDKLTVYSTWYL